jgi:hypothetical protein
MRGFDLGLGDRNQPFAFATDIFDTTRYFSGRGLTIRRAGERQTLTAFGGLTTRENSVPFFRTFLGQEPTGMVVYERKLNEDVRIQSHNLFQDQFTSLQSLSLRLRPGWMVAATGGIGASDHYAAVATKYEQRKFQIMAGYSNLGDGFQRISGLGSTVAEHAGLNARFRYMPTRNLQVFVGHENLFLPPEGVAQPVRTSLNSGGFSAGLKGFNLSGSMTQSSGGGLRTRTESFSVSRKLTSRLNVSVSLLGLKTGTERNIIYTASVQEKVFSHLTLNQGITRNGGVTTFSGGGRLVSNRLTLSLDHQLIYSPLAGGFRGKSVVQVWSVSLSFRLFRGLRVRADSYVDPYGKVRYTTYADGIHFARDGEDELQSPTQPIPAFAKFVVRGIVQDVQGNPIWGISVQVDGQNAYSDNSGQFFVRFKNSDRYPVSMNPARALNPTVYEIVQAPDSALAQPDDVAVPIVIVVRRARDQGPPPRRRSTLDGTEDPEFAGVDAETQAPDAAGLPRPEVPRAPAPNLEPPLPGAAKAPSDAKGISTGARAMRPPALPAAPSAVAKPATRSALPTSLRPAPLSQRKPPDRSSLEACSVLLKRPPEQQLQQLGDVARCYRAQATPPGRSLTANYD